MTEFGEKLEDIRYIKTKDGKIIFEVENIMKRWNEDFEI